jgi:hypothetical protein
VTVCYTLSLVMARRRRERSEKEADEADARFGREKTDWLVDTVDKVYLLVISIRRTGKRKQAHPLLLYYL